MHPIAFELGALKIHWYGICMAAAFLLGLGTWVVLGRRDGRDAAFCSDLLFWVMVAGLLGGRLAYVLSNPLYYLQYPQRVFYLWEGGLIYYGGFVGAITAVWLYARQRGLAFFELLDFAITALPLSHAVGRLGCFLNGCCFGRPFAGAGAIAYPPGSLPWHRHLELGLIAPGATHSLGVHPVQLYEALFNLLLFPVLIVVYRRRKRPGQVLGAYLLLYPLGRFTLEYLRGTERHYAGALSAAQLLSLGLFTAGLLVLLIPKWRRRTAPAPGA